MTMKLLSKIASARANVVETVLIAAGSSVLTVFIMNGFGHTEQTASLAGLRSVSTTASVLDCGAEVYSPVQRQCVSQEIFDGEMARLFAALGIDASIYGADTETK